MKNESNGTIEEPRRTGTTEENKNLVKIQDTQEQNLTLERTFERTQKNSKQSNAMEWKNVLLVADVIFLFPDMDSSTVQNER